MLEVKGIQIANGLPFDQLELITELLDFDGEPMLLHLKDERGSDWVCYWVDFDESHKRWVYGKVSIEELYYYLIGSKSLKSLFQDLAADYVFLLDFDINGQCTSVIMLNSYAIPEKYLAGENSYYSLGINEYYQVYLKDHLYIDRLRHESYRLIAKPSDDSHGPTVSAKDAAMVLHGASKSMEGFIDVTGAKMLEQKPITTTKKTKKINRFKNDLSPRVANNLFHSFEVWLTMDVITLEADDDEEKVWRNTLIEMYKNEVLNVDISNETDAKIIANKYTPEERKKIFEPLIRIYDNDNISIKITDYKNTFERDFKKKPLSEEFKQIVTPKPTKEQAEEEKQKRLKLFQFVVALEEGQDISSIKIKDLKENLLFGDEQPEAPYTIHSPMIYNNISYVFRKDIKGKFLLYPDGVKKIFHPELEIEVEGEDVKEIDNAFKGRLVDLILEYTNSSDQRKATEERFIELAKYI